MSNCCGQQSKKEPRMLYDKCPTSSISNLFEVPCGMHAQIKLYDMPDDWCVRFEEQLCFCCCDILFVPVTECGVCCPLQFTCDDIGTTLCLPAGSYRALITDEDGDPQIPIRKEIVMKVSFFNGPCPSETSCTCH